MFLKYRSESFLLPGNSPRFLPWGPKSWSWYASSSTLLFLIQSHFWSSQELLTAACTHPSTPPFTLLAPLSWFCSLSLEWPQWPNPHELHLLQMLPFLPTLPTHTQNEISTLFFSSVPYIWQIPFHCIIFISFHLLDNSLQETGRVGSFFVSCVFPASWTPLRVYYAFVARKKGGRKEGRLGKWHEGRERRQGEEAFSLH